MKASGSALAAAAPDRRGLWTLSALVIFVAASVGAFLQPAAPAKYQGSAFPSAGWWAFPVERNAAEAADAIIGELNSVASVPGTDLVWVVGNRGLILHSADGGRHWTWQNPRAAAPRTTARRQAGWLPSVYAMEEPPKKPKDPGAILMMPPSPDKGPNVQQQAPPNVQQQGQYPGQYGVSPSTLPLIPYAPDKGPAVQQRAPVTVPPKAAAPAPDFADAGDDLLDVIFADPLRGWAAARGGTVLVTTDGGKTWSQNPNPAWRLRWTQLLGFRFTPRSGPCWGVGANAIQFFGISANGTVPFASCRLASQDIPPVYRMVKAVETHPEDGMGQGYAQLGVLLGGYRVLAANAARFAEGLERQWSDDAISTTPDWRYPSTAAALWLDPRTGRGWSVAKGGLILRTNDNGRRWFAQSRPPGSELQAPAALRTWPAPWYYLSLLVVGLLLRRGTGPAPPPPPVAGIQDVLLSDKPLEAGAPDVMNFGQIAAGLSRFLRNEKTLPPLTIAINGEWGTGKSSLMNLLKADLQRFGFRPVWFNAWHHQKEEHLLAALLENIRAQAVPHWWRPENWFFRMRLLRIRGWRHWAPLLLLLGVGSFLAALMARGPGFETVIDGIVRGIKSSQMPTGILPTFAFLTTVISAAVTFYRGFKAFGVNPGELMASVSLGAGVRQLQAQTSFRHRFATEFCDVTRALGARSMLIFIDDLDRCQPENVLDVLEAVNFLVSSGDCFIVLGMARERVEHCVGLRFEDLAKEMADVDPRDTETAAREIRVSFARQYLDKLINIEIPLAEPSAEQARRLLVADEPKAPPVSTRTLLLRDATRAAVQAAPALAAAATVAVGIWFASAVSPPPAAPVGTAITAAAVPGAAASAAAAAGTEAAQPAPSRLMTKTGPAPELRPAAPAEPGTLWPVALATLILGSLAVWKLRQPPGLIIRDSAEFETALQVWCPVITSRQNTPRALKRFLNRVRYLAMYQAPEIPAGERIGGRVLEWLDRVLGRLVSLLARAGAGQPAVRPPAAHAIPEPTLVALAALHHSRLDWLSAVPDPAPALHKMDADLREMVAKTIAEHREKLGSWPPTPDDVERFYAILPQVRVARANSGAP